MIVRIERNIPLAPLTSFKIGGVADYFCRVQNEEELRGTLAFARERSLLLCVLGGGTNVLVSDAGFRGLVVKVEMRGIFLQNPPLCSPSFIKEGVGGGFLVVASAGEPWDSLVLYAVENGLWGIENLSGIPGTVGAAPVQNIGAYGTELKNVLEWVEAIDVRTDEARKFLNDECRLGYRDSIFKTPEGKHYIITRVALRLQKDGVLNLSYKDLTEYFKWKDVPTLADIRRAVLHIRARKFPDLTRYGTAGSFFKNPIIPRTQYEKLKERYPDLPVFPILKIHPLSPSFSKGGGGGRIFGLEREELVKIPLAWILDNVCHLKGFVRAEAALWENQPLVLVNRGGASATEVRALAEEVAERVRREIGIVLEWEVQEV